MPGTPAGARHYSSYGDICVFAGSATPDLLSHKPDVRNRKGRKGKRQKPDQMRPDQQKALVQRKVTAQRSDQLRIGNGVDRPRSGIHQNGTCF